MMVLQSQVQTVVTIRCMKESEDLPEAVSTAGGDPFRVLMAPWDAEDTVLTMLRWEREAWQHMTDDRSAWQEQSGMFFFWSMENRFIIWKAKSNPTDRKYCFFILKVKNHFLFINTYIYVTSCCARTPNTEKTLMELQQYKSHLQLSTETWRDLLLLSDKRSSL